MILFKIARKLMGWRMTTDKKSDEYRQLNIFDNFPLDEKVESKLTVKDIDEAIKKLLKAKKIVKEKEDLESQRKAKEEAERKGKEEQERKDAHVKEVTCMDLPLDWNNSFDFDKRTQGVHVESIPDALIMSLTTLGRVDIEYIASITGATYKTVISTLKGSIYQNPLTWNECFYQGWETAEEYLSGNLMRKWSEAKEASTKYKGYFDDNVKAIEKVLPPTVASEDIYITLGSPWLPADIIDDFIAYLFGDPMEHCLFYGRQTIENEFKTIHDEITGTWEIPYKSRYYHSVGVSKTYGTDRIEALYILERTLNMKAVSVFDEVVSPTNPLDRKRVLNESETVAAIEKQKKLIDAFQKWVWTNNFRRERLEIIFENNFSCVRKRNFDGSFLTFPTMSKSVNLYPYQKDAVARIIFTPNTLLAHDVGAGKTYVMVAAGQEMRRMGLSKKNMYVVPNNILGQWRNIFLTMYPNAKLLCVDPKSFTVKKRESVLKKIRDEDFDGIVIAYSCFEQIKLSKDYYINELREKKSLYSKLVNEKSKSTKRLRNKKEAIEKELSELVLKIDEHKTIYFDELGIDRLFVDEAHNFKNIPLETKINNVLGINSSGSKKCQDMLDKVHMLQKKNDGKGVVFATGTPITNSITDIYVMQQFLQSGELALLDLQSFDAWIGMFAERRTEFEIDVDTSTYRLATRFSKFHNLPELTALLSSIADFHQVGEAEGIPESDYIDALISKTPEFEAYLKDISVRADDVRQGRVSRNEDNMLKITTDGRKAALDLRLVDKTSTFSQFKVARCAENVAKIYFDGSPEKSTQLIFCDTSTPKDGFNIYDELKGRLISLGVPNDQIAFIHDADTETERTKLFTKIRNGDIRILIGSTFKLGLGVNVQDRLIALHHIDVPWRPADMTQREGRILRQGNMNKKVFIYRYVTEGSFDAYSWQLLETKQRFISDLLSGSVTVRSEADTADTVLNYAEVKALAIGNPLIKERVEAANELTRYQTLQRKLVESKIRMEKELFELPKKIEHHKDLIQRCEEDISFYDNFKKENLPATDTDSKKDEVVNRKKLREYISSAVRENVLCPKEKVLTNYRGFNIILPQNMTKEKPYVWIEKNGKYYVELGDTDIGNLIRIENCLDSIGEYRDRLQKELYRLSERELEIKKELSKSENYADEIAYYKDKVKRLDIKLGVE